MATQQQAARVAARMNLRSHVVAEAYRCPNCRQWHVSGTGSNRKPAAKLKPGDVRLVRPEPIRP